MCLHVTAKVYVHAWDACECKCGNVCAHLYVYVTEHTVTHLDTVADLVRALASHAVGQGFETWLSQIRSL